MPRIPVFLPDPKLPQPIATAQQFGAGVGRALQDVGGELKGVASSIDDFRTINQVSELNSELTKTQTELSKLWQETLAEGDPHDENLASDFMRDVVTPRLQDLSGIGKTRRSRVHFENQQNQITSNFAASTLRGQVDLAGAAAVADMETSLNNISSQAALDPASMPFLLQQFDGILDSQVGVGGMDRKTAIKFGQQAREQIAIAGAQGAIQLNPGAAKEILAQGAFADHISGSARLTLLRSAEAQVKSQGVASAKFLSDQSALARSEYIDDFINPDGTLIDQATPEMFQKVEADPRFQGPEGQADKEAVFKFLRGTLDDPTTKKVSNPQVTNDFDKRLALPQGDPNKLSEAQVNDAMMAGDLTRTDRDAYLKQTTIAATPSGQSEIKAKDIVIDGLKGSIAKSSLLGGLDKTGEQNFATFKNLANSVYTAKRDAGISHEDLVDRSSPHYIGLLAEQFFPTNTLDPEVLLNTITEGATLITDPVTGAFQMKPGDGTITPREPTGDFNAMKKRLDELNKANQ